ncbi:MAG TPA: mechanosensitive ion channel domain-containing protein [Thermoanaerobaculia bacterium]
MIVLRRFLPFVLALGLAAWSGVALAQEAPRREPLDDEVVTAPVVVDGVTLLRLRGAGAYTAERRAAAVARRFIEAAEDPSFNPAALRIVETGNESRLMAGGSTPILRLFDADGAVEALDRKALAKVALETFRKAMVAYRAARTQGALLGSAGRAVLAFLLAALAGFAVLRLGRGIERRLQSRLRERVHAVAIQSFEVLRAEQLLTVVRDLVRLGKGIVLALIGYLFLQYALAQFPWTRAAADRLGEWIVNPLRLLGGSLVEHLPDLIFLLVLYFVVRGVLRLLRLFFDAVGRGDVSFEHFDSDWADPTYKLVRLAVIALGIVIAYPYIPGSSSEAFKGISIFFGVLVSLGASSIVGNAIAGFTMIYRRAFREGDMVRYGDILGRVTKVRLMVTHLRTPKNEEVVLPNSKLLADEIVNYTTLAQDHGLILHTQVNIGYGTPWRQVEAMLLEAARRTPGLAAEPPPYVLLKSLGEFAVTYEINVPCADPPLMPRLYAELHRRILDVFNEYGVQIMTPAYEGDPEQPKVVANEEWYRAPAARPEPEAVPAVPRAGERP